MIRNRLFVNPTQLAENMIRKLKEKRGNSPSSAVLEAAIIIAFMVLALIILGWACLDDFTTDTGLLWFLVLFCTKNISATAMTCNIEPHVQCIWSIETESNGRRSCCFDESCVCQLNYLLHYDCLNVHETQSLLNHQKTFWAVCFSTTFYFTVKNIYTRKGK